MTLDAMQKQILLSRYDTTNFKHLLSTVVIAMDNFVNREDIPSADMEVMINFVKTLMGDSYKEHFKLS